MKIKFYGAAQTTTGSMHLVEANGARILLDCGLYQGHRKEAFEKNRNLPVDPRTLNATNAPFRASCPSRPSAQLFRSASVIVIW